MHDMEFCIFIHLFLPREIKNNNFNGMEKKEEVQKELKGNLEHA